MRTRVIKPDFWSDEKMSSLSMQARLVFIGLWTVSDDYGVSKGHAAWLKSQIMPYDDIKIDVFQKWLNELEAAGRIVQFEHHGEKYYHIVNFKKHQYISHPSPARFPSPPENIRKTSGEIPEIFRKDSGKTPAELELELELEFNKNLSEKKEIGDCKGKEETSPENDGRRKPSQLSDDEWEKRLKTNPAYHDLDIDRELGKCRAWCEENHKVYSRKRIINWLNRAEKPLQGGKGGSNGVGTHSPLAKHNGQGLSERELEDLALADLVG